MRLWMAATMVLPVMMLSPSRLAAGQDRWLDASAGIALQKLPDVTLIRGQAANVRVRVLRDNIRGDLKVHFSDLPPGVHILNEERRIIVDEATYTLQADPKAALVRGQQATVTVRTADGRFTASEVLWISVKEQE